MGTSRVFIGRLPNEVTKGDLEHFFRHYGRVKDVSLKLGYAFVDLESSRDAEEAVHGLNNKHLCGYRVNVELSKSRAPSGGYSGYSRDDTHSNYRSDRYGGRGRDFGGRDFGGRERGSRYGIPEKTRYRMVVENLTTRYSWQDLKDMLSQCAEVTFADAHTFEKNKALVYFATHRDLQRAMEKYQGKEINGRSLKLIDDTQDSQNRSRSPLRRTSRSPSSGSGGSDARPRCPRSVSRSSSHSGSPKKRGGGASRKQSRSGSVSPPRRLTAKRSRSHSRSKSSSSGRVNNSGKHPRVVYENSKAVDRNRSSSRSRSRSIDKSHRKRSGSS